MNGIYRRLPEPKLVLRTGHSKLIEGIQFSPNGEYLATLGSDQQLLVWDTRSHEEVYRNRIGVTYTYPAPITFSADSSRIMWGEMFTVKSVGFTRHEAPRVLFQGRSPVVALATSRNGRWLSIGFGDGSVTLHTFMTPRKPQTLSQGGAPVSSLAIDHESRTLAVGRFDGHVTIFDLNSASVLKEHFKFASVDSLTFDEAASLLAVGATRPSDLRRIGFVNQYRPSILNLTKGSFSLPLVSRMWCDRALAQMDKLCWRS